MQTRERRLLAEEVREIRLQPPPAGPPLAPVHLFLRTGDELLGTITAGDADGVTIATASLGTLTVPLDLVRALAWPEDSEQLARFRREVLPEAPGRDEVVLRTWLRRSGALESVGPDGVSGEWDALGSARFGREEALGVRLAPLGPLQSAPPSQSVQLELADGCRVGGELVQLAEGRLRIALPYAGERALPLAEVAALFLQSERFVYVSDLEPVEVEERAQLISFVFAHQRDRTVAGGPLRLGGRSYRKGIGVHAYTRLVYELGGRYVQLRAVIGLDDEARAMQTVEGTVRFQVRADGRPLLGAEGVLLDTEAPPRPIELELRGVQRLELIADFGPSGDTLARGLWADAFLVRAKP
ncbi:MAG: hypothetical protein KatS3mg102_1200 [Planctomycetota bacterium]|nr:MAG: hypothetical protein KatS3mg102_1200 [Planctomycetota bacterium]